MRNVLLKTTTQQPQELKDKIKEYCSLRKDKKQDIMIHNNNLITWKELFRLLTERQLNEHILLGGKC